MKTVEIVERIEGEAKLNFSWKNKIIDDVRIDFLNFRGFEFLLEGKPVLDSLVYTPRICGICGQAHLKATVEALENIYKNVNEPLRISKKAKILREIGLNIEIIDSHIKWFYMFILPDIINLEKNDLGIYSPLKGKRWLQASQCASETIKALAIIGGQWPHTSYMIPGGVVCDPTHLEIVTLENYIDNAVSFFEDIIVGVSFENYLSFTKVNELDLIKGDLLYFKELSFNNNLENTGKSYNRFISLGNSNLFKKGKINENLTQKLDFLKIKEDSEFTFDVNKSYNTSSKHTWSKSVRYDKLFYETGPLARAIISDRTFIKDIHKNYDDSVFTRIISRIDEIAHLLSSTKQLIKELDLSEESYIKPKFSLNEINEVTSISVVEACRGSLYHELSIEEGIIKKYNIITPTVWNLGPQINKQKGIAQNAIIGTSSSELAKIILRSFDVCSVCTTH